MNDVIRAFTAEDLQGVLRLLQRLQEIETTLHDGRRLWNEQDTLAYYRGVEKRMREGDGKAFVAQNGQDIVGFIMGWVEDDSDDLQVHADEMRYGFIGEVIVADQAQRRGVYQELASAMENYLFAKGVKKIRTCTLGNNLPMQKAAEKRGYKPYEIIMEKVRGPLP